MKRCKRGPYFHGSYITTAQRDRQIEETDRRTDDMQSQYRALHYNASRGKKKRLKTLTTKTTTLLFLKT